MPGIPQNGRLHLLFQALRAFRRAGSVGQVQKSSKKSQHAQAQQLRTKLTKTHTKIYQKSIQNRSKIDRISNKFQGPERDLRGCSLWPQHKMPNTPKFFGGQVGAKLKPSWTQNPLRSCLNVRLRFGSRFGASWARCWSHFWCQLRSKKSI